MAESVSKEWGAGDYAVEGTWVSSNTAVTTSDFNSQIHSDFTVIMNTSSESAAGNIVLDIEASYDDGATYVQVAQSSALAWNGVPVRYVYDYDALGPLPMFRLKLDPASAETQTFKIKIYPHAG